jgi:hypothetical protein
MPETSITDSNNRVDLVMPSTEGGEKLNQVIQELSSSSSKRQEHLNKHERWYKKRYGIRPRVATWPWRNAANLHLPLVDKTIRRAKPKYIRLVESVEPIVTFMHSGKDIATVRALESEFHNNLKNKMGIVEKISLGTDKMLEKGYFVCKVVQEFNEEEIDDKFDIDNLPEEVANFFLSQDVPDEEIGIELANRLNLDLDDEEDVNQIRKIIDGIRSGKKVINFKRTNINSDFPSMFIRDPRKIVVPLDTTDIRKARMIKDRVSFSNVQIEANIASGVWSKKNGYEKYRDCIRISSSSRRW